MGGGGHLVQAYINYLYTVILLKLQIKMISYKTEGPTICQWLGSHLPLKHHTCRCRGQVDQVLYRMTIDEVAGVFDVKAFRIHDVCASSSYSFDVDCRLTSALRISFAV